jgi:hypothetical protein
MRTLAAFFPCLLLACSGADFGVSGDPEDTSVSSETGDETGSDTASDTATDTATDSGADTCVKNACGGCEALVGKPGDACPSCGGKLVCKGTDSNECDSTAPKNECGGCSMLAIAKGTVCGVCMTGSYVCDGTDSTKCKDPVTGAAPMSACGTCGTKKVVCDATATGGTKCEGDDANECGGCGPLAHSTTEKCGVCMGGTYACDPLTKDRTRCDDPVPSTTKPGDACGKCMTLKLACAGDGKSLVCPMMGNDANECGGCAVKFTAANKPMAACGACGGKYVCNGTDATKCTDNNPVPLATKCGMYCSASSYMCSSGQTVCTANDDRKDGVDTLAAAKNSPMWTFDNSSPYAISFATQRLGAITSFTVSMFRYDETGSAPDPGNVRFRLIKGAPTTTPAVSDVLATINIPGDKILDTGSGAYDLTITLTTPTAIFPAATPLYIEIQEDSFRYNYAIAGGTPAAVSKVDWWYPSTAPGGYDTYKAADPLLKVGMTGCF